MITMHVEADACQQWLKEEWMDAWCHVKHQGAQGHTFDKNLLIDKHLHSVLSKLMYHECENTLMKIWLISFSGFGNISCEGGKHLRLGVWGGAPILSSFGGGRRRQWHHGNPWEDSWLKWCGKDITGEDTKASDFCLPWDRAVGILKAGWPVEGQQWINYRAHNTEPRQRRLNSSAQGKAADRDALIPHTRPGNLCPVLYP